MYRLRLPISSGVSSSFSILAFVSFVWFLLLVLMSIVASLFVFIPLGFSSAFSEDVYLSLLLQIQSSVVSILFFTIVMQL